MSATRHVVSPPDGCAGTAAASTRAAGDARSFGCPAGGRGRDGRRRPARALAPHRRDSELVYELVERDTGVACDLGELEPVRLDRDQELLPQISIGDGFLMRVHPAALLPAVEPAIGERLHQ